MSALRKFYSFTPDVRLGRVQFRVFLRSAEGSNCSSELAMQIPDFFQASARSPECSSGFFLPDCGLGKVQCRLFLQECGLEIVDGRRFLQKCELEIVDGRLFLQERGPETVDCRLFSPKGRPRKVTKKKAERRRKRRLKRARLKSKSPRLDPRFRSVGPDRRLQPPVLFPRPRRRLKLAGPAVGRKRCLPGSLYAGRLSERATGL